MMDASGPVSMLTGTLSTLPQALQRRLLEAQFPNIPRLREDIAEALIHQNVSYEESVEKLLDIDCPLLAKYEKLDVQEILQTNLQSSEEGLSRIVVALSILVKYGVNLLKPISSRPQGWASVNFSNAVFREKVDSVKGTRKILQNLGYTVVTEEAMSYPKNKQPHLETVSKVTTDIVVAKAELRHYISGSHKYPDKLKDLLPLQRGYDDTNNNISHQMPTPSELHTSPPGNTNEACTNWANSCWNKTSQSIIEPEPKPPDECDICEDNKAEWMCALCDKKQLCTACDDRWHSHPKRREHKRSPLDKTSNTTPPTADQAVPDSEPGAAQVNLQPRQSSGNAIMVIPPRISRAGNEASSNSMSPEPLPVMPRFDKDAQEKKSEPPKINLMCNDMVLQRDLEHSNYNSIMTELESIAEIPDKMQQLEGYLQKLDQQIKQNDSKISEYVRKTAQFTIESSYLSHCFARDKLKCDRTLLKEYKEKLVKEQKGSMSSMSDVQLEEHLSGLRSLVRPPPESYTLPSTSPSTSSSSFPGLNGMPASPLLPGGDGRSVSPAVQPSPQASLPPTSARYWNCQHCTFENSADVIVCEMCNKTSSQKKIISVPEVDGKESSVSSNSDLIDLSIEAPNKESGPSTGNRNPCENSDMSSIFIQDQLAVYQFFNKQGKNENVSDDQVLITLPDALNNESTTDTFTPGTNPPPEIRIPTVPAGPEDTWSMLDVPPDGDPTPSFFERVGTARDTLRANIQNRLSERELQTHNQELKKQSKELIRQLKFTENSGYSIDEFRLAQKKVSAGGDPTSWLTYEWELILQDFVHNATEKIKDHQSTYKGQFPMTEAKACLLEKGGNVEEALVCGVDRYIKRLSELSGALSDQKSLSYSLNLHKGDLEKARETVIGDSIRKINQFIWATTPAESPTEDNIYAEMNTDVDINNIKNADIPYDRRVRMVMVSTDLPWFKSEDVVQLLDRPDLPVDATYDDILEAVKNVDTVEDAVSFICKECEICYATFPPRKVLNLSSCQCNVCDECMKQHLEVVIKERHVKDMTCPVCQRPDIQNPEEIGIHFSFLENIIQVLAVARDIYELYLKKLTEWNLMKDPHFRWCSHCGSGFIFQGDPGQLKMICPSCRKATCYECKKRWETQHDGISCDQFQKWKEDNDPDFQAAGLKKHLEANGIDCPSCKMRYDLAKGGCMHFKCTQCKHEFCCGCSQPFKIGKACKKSKKCAKAGLHCHHPRDCLYYLRDFDVKDLLKLLQDNDIDVCLDTLLGPRNPEEADPKCRVMEQKETADGLKDDPCGRPVSEDFNALCEIHFKEYLVGMVNRNGIDPVEIMDTNALTIQLERLEKNPPKQKKKENAEAYRKRLVESVRTQIPLPLRRSQSMASVHLI